MKKSFYIVTSLRSLAMTRTAFTLAEVLITLGIIGIIAALTMLALVVKYQEKATVTKLKKFYSIMSQAYVQALEEYGDPTNWNLVASESPVGAKNMAEKFKPFLNVVKEEATNDGYTYYLADGSTIIFIIRNINCLQNRGTGRLSQGCATISYFSVKPDEATPGKNTFAFGLLKDGIIPNGTTESVTSFENGCLNSASKSWCTAWVIYNENLDYWRCNDLSWGGKTKCD